MTHQGKKTYAVAIGFLLTGVGGFLTGAMTPAEAVQLVLEGLGIAALRAGISKGA